MLTSKFCLKFILQVDRVVYFFLKLTRNIYAAWTDFMMSVVAADDWELLNLHCYKRINYYDEKVQNHGLFLWEQVCIDRFFPKPPGTILIIGAGSGREAKALLDMGYDIIATEVVDEFIKHLHNLTTSTKSKVLRCSMQKMLGSSTSRRDLSCDAIIISHGIFSHLPTDESRILFLKQLLCYCPDGPILISWHKFLRLSAWRRVWRTILSVIFGKRLGENISYRYDCGPITYLQSDIIRSIILDSGLETLHFNDSSAYSHCVCKSVL